MKYKEVQYGVSFARMIEKKIRDYEYRVVYTNIKDSDQIHIEIINLQSLII